MQKKNKTNQLSSLETNKKISFKHRNDVIDRPQNIYILDSLSDQKKFYSLQQQQAKVCDSKDAKIHKHHFSTSKQ